jgi:hypothetical protein
LPPCGKRNIGSGLPVTKDRCKQREISSGLPPCGKRNIGSYFMADNLVNTFNSQADICVGGRMLSAGALGSYSLPRELSLRLASIVNPIVTRVGLPVMAQVQGDPTGNLRESTGQDACRTTCSAVEPISRWAMPVRPWVARAMRSHSCSLA